jgi:uncharacterized membrane protein YoaK (UPF0700 family)
MALAAVAALVAAAAALAWATRLDARPESALIVLLGAAMGIQNATVRHLGVADMTTTVLTLTLAGLAADLRIDGGTVPRIGRRVGSVAALLAGAAAGAWLFAYGLTPVLLTATAVATAAAVASEDVGPLPRVPRLMHDA